MCRKKRSQKLNKVFGNCGSYFMKSPKEPAAIVAWKPCQLGLYWLLGAGISGYALFIKKYNILWTFAPFIPLWAYIYYQWGRQPTQEIENCYKYLLTKRAATCEMEKNKRAFNANSWA